MSSEPRKRLDWEQVLSTAEAVIDRDGWPELTMSALARELGGGALPLPARPQPRGPAGGDPMPDDPRSVSASSARPWAARARPRCGRWRRPSAGSRWSTRTATSWPCASLSTGWRSSRPSAGAALTAVIRSYGIEDASFEPHLSAFAALHGVVVLESVGFFPSPPIADDVFNRVLDSILELLAAAAPRSPGRPNPDRDADRHGSDDTQKAQNPT